MGTYALISIATGIVVNTIVLNDPSGWTPPEGYFIVETDTASTGWSYADGIFIPPPEPSPSDEELSSRFRQQREGMLRGIYDPGIMMALRALRMAATPEQIDYAEGKVSELDSYAESLLAIPDQVGFPQTIIWPVAPTK